jgi:hypothetical protein
MLAELIVILIILATVGFIYLKGTVIKALLFLINAFVASTVAFAYFETLGRLIIGHGMVVEWALAIVLILTFALVLAILSAVSGKLVPADIDIYFSDFADRVIKCLIAAFAGFVIAGVVLTTAAMAPIGTSWPYERFSSNSRPREPDKTLILNADGFVTSFTSWLSRGSMSGKKSLAVFHPDFLNEIYMNRLGYDKDNSAVAGEYAISVETAWTPQTELISALDNQPMSEGPQAKAVIVKARTDDTFTMSQVRLVCKESGSADNFRGSGQVVWPVGYIQKENIVDRKNLSEKVALKQLDFVFYIPANTVPVMLQFKQNAVAWVGKLTSGNNPPATESTLIQQ